MKEHETQDHPSTAAGGDGWSEEMGDPAEEPDQRWQDMQRLPQHERIRLILLGFGLLALVVCFLLDLFTGAFLPLFVVIVVVYLGYRRIDAWLDAHEPHDPHTPALIQ